MFLHVSDVMLATQSDMPIFTVVLNQLVRQLAPILHTYCATTALFGIQFTCNFAQATCVSYFSFARRLCVLYIDTCQFYNK